MAKNGNFFKNLFTSGYQPELGNEKQEELLMRHIIMNSILYMGMFLLIVFSIQSFQANKSIQGIADLVLLSLMITSYIMLRVMNTFIPAALVAMCSGGILYLWLAAIQGAGNAGVLWSYTYPIMAVFLFGMTGGIILGSVYWAALIFVVLFPQFFGVNYDISFSLRVIGVYFLVFALSVVYEFSRKQKEKAVNRLTKTLQSERDEMGAMKDNMSDAIFLLNEDLLVQHQYSHSMEEIIGIADLADQYFPSLMGAALSDKEKETLSDYFQMLIKQSYDAEMLADLNPLSGFVYYLPNDQGERYLKCSFTSILRENGKPYILGSLSDQSKNYQLQQQLKEEETKRLDDMRALFEVIHVEPRVLHDFIEDAEHEFDRINTCLKDNKRSSHDVMVEIYQAVHAIKSNAVILGLESLGEKVHILEQDISQLRQQVDIPFSDVLRITISIERIQKEKDKLNDLIKKIISFRFGEGRLQEEYVMVRTMERVIEKVGSDLGKRAILQIGRIDPGAVENGPRRVIKELLIQMVRNAMYHGIELPETRLALGKPEIGTIRLNIEMEKGQINIILGDDGKGLDYNAIAAKAQTLGLIKEPAMLKDRNSLIKILFSPGFSTAEKADLHAGRGVGLSMVRDRVKEAGGTIRLQSEDGKGMTFKVTIPSSNDLEDLGADNALAG